MHFAGSQTYLMCLTFNFTVLASEPTTSLLTSSNFNSPKYSSARTVRQNKPPWTTTTVPKTSNFNPNSDVCAAYRARLYTCLQHGLRLQYIIHPNSRLQRCAVFSDAWETTVAFNLVPWCIWGFCLFNFLSESHPACAHSVFISLWSFDHL